jgi:hypothetical protein
VIFLAFENWRERRAARKAMGSCLREHLRPLHPAPVGTILLTIGLALAGIAAFFHCRSRRCPGGHPHRHGAGQLPGASPSTMASTVASPLERDWARSRA